MSKLFSKNNLINQVFNEYTVIPNSVIELLGHKELGVFCYLASRSIGEEFNKPLVCSKILIKEKELNIILKKFIDLSYIVKEKNNYIFTLTCEPITVRKKPIEIKKSFDIKDYVTEIEVLKELNKFSNTTTKETNQTALKSINKVLVEYSKEDVIGVIRLKHSEWYGTDQEKYIRHQTLFRKNNFEKYIGEYLANKNKTSTSSRVKNMYSKSTDQQKKRLREHTIELSKDQIKSSQEKAKSIISNLTKLNEKKAK